MFEAIDLVKKSVDERLPTVLINAEVFETNTVSRGDMDIIVNKNTYNFLEIETIYGCYTNNALFNLIFELIIELLSISLSKARLTPKSFEITPLSITKAERAFEC